MLRRARRDKLLKKELARSNGSKPPVLYRAPRRRPQPWTRGDKIGLGTLIATIVFGIVMAALAAAGKG